MVNEKGDMSSIIVTKKGSLIQFKKSTEQKTLSSWKILGVTENDFIFEKLNEISLDINKTEEDK